MPKRRRPKIDGERLPNHIGIIMDGNGRWAKTKGMARTEGHRAGSLAVRRVVRACRRLGVSHLTLFAFSAQNWGRPEYEVQALMNLLAEFIANEWQEIMDKDIRVIQLGELRRVPVDVRKQLQELIKATRTNRSMTLALALSYGAREEIIHVIRKLTRRGMKGKLNPLEIDQELVSDNLYTSSLPDPDLIIRTGGEKRISNFLLWQSAYAEFFFSKKLWPDFSVEDLYGAIAEFQKRNRRFGLTDEQVDQVQ
ncbi:MAG: isoprenyl transferase [Deltaproteobacteria bacterium]|nr:isoprenyl transferase [Deltaproteobacteria bacterium]MBW1870709.1 isoprenyl transferase [Deltaproteobacteria bacterium]